MTAVTVRRRTIGVALLCCLVASSATAAKTPRLRFTGITDLAGLGLRVRLMPDSNAIPLPAPTIYPYAARDPATGTSKRLDMYDPHELWRSEQTAGLWTDEFGNAIMLAVIARPFPGGVPGRPHVTREEYDAAGAAAGNVQDRWTQTALLQWVTDFTGASKAEAEAVKRPPTNLARLLRFTLQGVAAQKMAYAFQVARRSIGSRQTTGEDWVFVLFNLHPMINLDSARTAIESTFLSSVSTLRAPTPSRTAPRDAPAPAAGTADTDPSAEFAASRKRVADSIRNMEDWWFEETDNYIVLSNLQRRHRAMVRYLKTNIEIMRSAYGKLVTPRRGISSVSVIRVFATPEEYENFVGSDYKWTGGLWVSHKKELVVRPIDSGSSSEQRDRVLSVTYHEGFHQYLSYALGGELASPWFNEGHAALFEAAEVRGSRLDIPENPTHAGYLEAMAREHTLDPRHILLMNYEQFYAGTDGDRQRNYALAWGLTYYLRKAAPVLDKKEYVAISERYCDALVKTGDPNLATTTAFSQVDMSALTRDLTAFWKSRSERRRAERNRLFASD